MKSISKDKKLRFLGGVSKYHPHPVFIHFPIALFIFGALMQSLFLVTGDGSFELSAFYSITFATASILPTVVTGMLSWWINYENELSSVFKNKLVFSAILVFVTVFAVTTRFFIPEISFRDDLLFYLYNASVLLNVPVVLIIAYNGGRVVWS
jgi:uncharacterized membrane protein